MSTLSLSFKTHLAYEASLLPNADISTEIRLSKQAIKIMPLREPHALIQEQ